MTEPVDERAALTPLVIGLTRSPTLWGVPYMAIIIIIGLSIVAWLVTYTFWSLLVAPLSYLVLFSLCAWDSRILDVLQVVARKTPRTRNKVFWGANSYGP